MTSSVELLSGKHRTVTMSQSFRFEKTLVSDGRPANGTPFPPRRFAAFTDQSTVQQRRRPKSLGTIARPLPVSPIRRPRLPDS